ncbi:type II secretion system F family protein [candidate division KSB1 bacterium]|nr:type II secretion system F family protein [candidate division KSB1 bacterium]
MPTYSYVIRDPSGRREESLVRASDLDAAISLLKGKGGTILSVREAKKETALKKTALGDQVALFFYRLRTRVPLEILVFFTRQLSTMFSAGLTLEKSIVGLQYEEKNRRFRKVLGRLSVDIKKGFSLSDALEKHPGVFSPMYVALVKAGEISGNLHTILEDLSDYIEALADTRRKVFSAMSYPLFVFIFLVIMLIGIFVFVIPMFREVYAKLGAQLPGPTRMLMGASQAISQNFLSACGITLLVLISLWLLAMTDRGRFIFDRLLLAFPVLGSLLKNAIMNKFSKTFGVLIGSGVPIMEAISLSQRVVGNKVIERGLSQARGLIKDGFSISNALKKTMVFPAILLQLIATGEETGEMDRLLNKAAIFYEKQVDAIVDRLTSLIEPILIVIIGVVIGSIIITIYLPVFYLGAALRRGL